MTRMGIIGSGAIGAGLGRLAVAAGDEVMIANSRGPETLADLVAELGAAAQAGTAEEAAGFGDLTILAVPLSAYGALPVEALSGRTVLSTGNYYPAATAGSPRWTPSGSPPPSTSPRSSRAPRS